MLKYSKLGLFVWISFPFPHVHDYEIISSSIRGSSFSCHMDDNELQFKPVLFCFLRMPEDKELHFCFERQISKGVQSCF